MKNPPKTQYEPSRKISRVQIPEIIMRAIERETGEFGAAALRKLAIEKWREIESSKAGRVASGKDATG